MAIGDIVTAARYNNIQSRIETVLGEGSGTDGYGQSLSSSTVSVGEEITALQMQQLYDDMFAARVHQTGTDPISIANIQVGDTVGENESDDPNGEAKGYTDFENLIPSIEGDKFLIHPSQASIESTTTSTRSTAWNGVIVHEFTITFSDTSARRHFFNAGGEIRLSATLIGGSGSKDSDWNALLTNMGTVSFNYNATTATGTGSVSAIGNFDLTTSFQQIFIKSGSGVYAQNDYNIAARAPTASTIQFRVEFRDDDNAYTDENVTGTITSLVQQFRPSGLYVTLPAPSYANNTTL